MLVFTRCKNQQHIVYIANINIMDFKCSCSYLLLKLMILQNLFSVYVYTFQCSWYIDSWYVHEAFTIFNLANNIINTFSFF